MSSVAPLRLKKGREEEVLAGMPWMYAGDIIESSQLLHVPAGSLVSIETHKGQSIGTGYYNAASQIACRVLTLAKEPIDQSFFQKRIEKALALREKLINAPYYRLVHSESDFLPGLLLDRFDNIIVAQVGTAGMEALQKYWQPALEALLQPQTIVLRNDIGARQRVHG